MDKLIKFATQAEVNAYLEGLEDGAESITENEHNN